jgi:hypothetical protein
MVSKDHRRSQNFPGEDASHAHKVVRAITYIRENPRTKRDRKNFRVKKHSYRQGEREVPKSHMMNNPKERWKGQDINNGD